MSNNAPVAVVEAALDAIAAELSGLPPVLVEAMVDLVRTVAQSGDIESAITRAKQNALADVEDAAAEQAADALLKAKG